MTPFRSLGAVDPWLRRALAALLETYGIEAVLGALATSASFMVDGGEEGDFATAARRAAVDLARAAASSARLASYARAIPYAEILRPTREQEAHRRVAS